MVNKKILSKGMPYIISAPSGGGKTSICKRILKSISGIAYSVSYTTREKRPGEKDGEDYFFVTNNRFKEMISIDYFLEWAQVHGNYYGTAKDFVFKTLDSGIDCLLDIDINGAKSLKDVLKKGVFIFLLPPSFYELKIRLSRRMTEDETQINLRLKKAIEEIKAFKYYQYLIINDDIATAVEEIKSIIIAQRCIMTRRKPLVEEILKSFSNNVPIV